MPSLVILQIICLIAGYGLGLRNIHYLLLVPATAAVASMTLFIGLTNELSFAWIALASFMNITSLQVAFLAARLVGERATDLSSHRKFGAGSLFLSARSEGSKLMGQGKIKGSR